MTGLGMWWMGGRRLEARRRLVVFPESPAFYGGNVINRNSPDNPVPSPPYGHFAVQRHIREGNTPFAASYGDGKWLVIFQQRLPVRLDPSNPTDRFPPFGIQGTGEVMTLSNDDFPSTIFDIVHSSILFSSITFDGNDWFGILHVDGFFNSRIVMMRFDPDDVNTGSEAWLFPANNAPSDIFSGNVFGVGPGLEYGDGMMLAVAGDGFDSGAGENSSYITPSLWRLNPSDPLDFSGVYGKIGNLPRSVRGPKALTYDPDDNTWWYLNRNIVAGESTSGTALWKLNPDNPSDETNGFGNRGVINFDTNDPTSWPPDGFINYDPLYAQTFTSMAAVPLVL